MEKIVAGNPDTRSKDIMSEKLRQLTELFPEAVTDGLIDFDVLRQLLGDEVTDADEKYGLHWHGKRHSRQRALTPSHLTLRPCIEDSVDWHKTNNLMIEGDNLEVLKLLQKSYAGRVKLIYIDPPYNTGRDFIYADDYRDNLEEYLAKTRQVDRHGGRLTSNTDVSGRFHTAWLNMAYPRLQLSRSLLREDGLIVVSIDQGEIAHLQLIMSEIYGRENFFAILTRKAMHTVRNSSKDFNHHADYLLVYGRNKSWFGEEKSRYIRSPADKSGNYRLDDGDGRGKYKLDPLHARNYYKRYFHTFSNGKVWTAPPGSYPRYSQQTLAEMEKDGRIHFEGRQPMAKRYLREVQDGVPPNTILDPEDVGYNFHGTKELRETLGDDKVFPQPKPTKLIRHLLRMCNDPEAIVLDFFAGSGTTAEAVWAQNVDDEGRRRFILVQLPEPLSARTNSGSVAERFCEGIGKPLTIAEITKERLRRSSRKLLSGNPGLTGDLGFRVFKLDSSNIRAWNPRPDDVSRALLAAIDHVMPGRTEQDILYELLLKLGLDLCAPMEERCIVDKTVYSVGAGTLLVCLAETVTRSEAEPLATGIADWHNFLAPAGDSIAIFRDSAFVDDVAKTNLSETLKQRGLAYVRSV